MHFGLFFCSFKMYFKIIFNNKFVFFSKERHDFPAGNLQIPLSNGNVIKIPIASINITEEMNRTSIWKQMNEEKALNFNKKPNGGNSNTTSSTVPQKRKNKNQ